MIFRFLFTIFFSCQFFIGKSSIGQRNLQDAKSSSWKPASYEVLGNYQSYTVTEFANVFSGGKNSIARIAPELGGLKGIKFPVNNQGLFDAISLKLKFSSRTRILVGIFRDSAKQNGSTVLSSLQLGKGKPDLKPVLTNAISVTGMPFMDIYAVHFPAGTHIIEYAGGEPWIIAGAVLSKQNLTNRNAGLPDGRLWEAFIIEGFYDEKPLFEIIGGPDAPVIDEGMPGTE